MLPAIHQVRVQAGQAVFAKLRNENPVEQAAALFQSLTLNHCFADGNKRIAFALTAVFLKMNGCRLSVDAKAGEEFIVKNIIKDKADLKEIRLWIEKHIK